MITCPICQHENPEGAEYCEDCGAALPAQDTAPAPTPPSTSPGSEMPAAENLPTGGPAAEVPSDVSDAAEGSVEPEPLPVEAAPAEAMPAETQAPAGTPSAGAVESTPAPPAPAPAAASTGQNPRLVGVRYGAPTGDEHPLLGSRLVVGRFDSETGPVDIDLSGAPESEQISRQHAEIYREADGRWHVKDLGSTNGVFVKPVGAATFGPRITAPQPLGSGDEIGFGNARFVFQTD